MSISRLAIYALSGINVGLFAFLAYLAARGWKKSITNRYYLALIASIVGWLLIANFEGLYGDSTLITKLDFFLASNVCFTFALFALSYSPVKRRRKTLQLVSLVGYALLVILSFSNLTFTQVPGTGSLEISKPLYGLYIVLLLLLALGVGGAYLYELWKKSEGIPRRQISYVLFGFTIPAGLLILLSAYNVLVQRVPNDLYSLLTNVGIIFTLLCTRAIFRYRFLEVRVVIQRSIVRVTSFLLLMLLYLVLILILRDSLISETKELNSTSVVVVGLLVILTVEPLRKYIYSFIDKRFELHDRKQEVIQQQLKIVLKSQRSLADLENVVQKAFLETARVDTVEYYDANSQELVLKPALRAYLQATGRIVISEELPYRFDEDIRFKQIHDEVSSSRWSAYVPVGQTEVFAGCFVLGQRKGKVPYGAQEVLVLKQLQTQSTDALLNVRLYKQAVERIKV